MAVVQPEITSYLKIPIPGENSDPFMNQFREYTRKIEEPIFFNKLFSSLFISAGGTRTWIGVSGILTWTADWEIPMFQYGFKVLVAFGTDGITRTVNLLDGQALVVTIPISIGANRTVNFQVLDTLDPNRNDQWVVGWRNGNTLQLKGIGEIT